MNKYIGKRKGISSLEMKQEYISIAKQDEKAAGILAEKELYREALYLCIQAMEKKIKGYICGKIDASNPYFSQKLKDVGHSLANSIDFLIEILSGNDENLKSQLSTQIKDGVFEEIDFSRLHNDCRYPFFSFPNKQYFSLEITKQDYDRICVINSKLDKYIKSFDRL